MTSTDALSRDVMHRLDVLAAAGEIVPKVEDIGAASAETVGTVGRFAISPGAANVIPGAVRLSVELRASADDQRHEALRGVREAISPVGAVSG